jgi:hypothetical protein
MENQPSREEHAMREVAHFGSRRRLAALAFLIALAALRTTPARANDEPPAKVDDRFAHEPKRPKSESKIQFSKSWDEAGAQAKRTGRRLLAYFTGDNCGWCRALEKRSFTDGEVVELSRQFVCVEVKVSEERNSRLRDKYRIDSIPRTIIFTPDGEVIERRTGYLAAAEYAAWLAGVGNTATAAELTARQPTAPPPVGFPEADADVVIWFVDATESLKRWNDGDWIGHAHLRRLLGAAGLRPRIEHISRDELGERWDRAKATGQAPDLVAADKLSGFVGELEKTGRLVLLKSERLTTTPEVASCSDFREKWMFVAAGSRNEPSTRNAVVELLRPGPETDLPGTVLPDKEGRDEATVIASRAAVAFLAGDFDRLKKIAAADSPQLTRCTKPENFRRDLEVEADSVEIRGNAAIAFARVELRFRSKKISGADPVVVVLLRDGSRWKAFAVATDVLSIRTLNNFCRLQLRPTDDQTVPPKPRMLTPPDGAALGADGKSFAWEIPVGGEPLSAQVCQVLLNSDESCSWPESRLNVYSGEKRHTSLLLDETAQDLTGASAKDMFWTVWSIGISGRISLSDVRRYTSPKFNY